MWWFQQEPRREPRSLWAGVVTPHEGQNGDRKAVTWTSFGEEGIWAGLSRVRILKWRIQVVCLKWCRVKKGVQRRLMDENGAWWWTAYCVLNVSISSSACSSPPAVCFLLSPLPEMPSLGSFPPGHTPIHFLGHGSDVTCSVEALPSPWGC